MGSIDDSFDRVLGTSSGRDDVVGTNQCKRIEIKPSKKNERASVSFSTSIGIDSENICVSTSRIAWTRAEVERMLRPKLGTTMNNIL
jgi:hypothetical protein